MKAIAETTGKHFKPVKALSPFWIEALGH